MNEQEYRQQYEAACDAKKYKEAVQVAQAMIDAGMSQGYVLKAQAWYLQDNSIMAVKALEDYLMLHPNDAEALYMAGVYEDFDGEKAVSYLERAGRMGHEEARDYLPVKMYSAAIDRWNRADDNNYEEQEEAVGMIGKAIQRMLERVKAKPNTYEFTFALRNMYGQLHELAKNGQTCLTDVSVRTVDQYGAVIKTETYTTRNYYGSGNIWEMREEMQRNKERARQQAKRIVQATIHAANVLDSYGARGDGAMLRLKALSMSGKSGTAMARWVYNYGCAMGRKERGAGYDAWLKDYKENAELYTPASSPVDTILRAREEGVLRDWLTEWYGGAELVPADAVDYLDEITPQMQADYDAAQQQKAQKKAEKEERSRKIPSVRKILIEQAASVPLKVLPNVVGCALQAIFVSTADTVVVGEATGKGVVFFVIALVLAVAAGVLQARSEKDKGLGWNISAVLGQLLLFFFMCLNIFFGLIILAIVWLTNRNRIE